MNLLPAVEAYINHRIAKLAKFHPKPADRIEELEMVRTLIRGLEKQSDMLANTLGIRDQL